MIISFLQFFVATLLAFCIFLGLGFIINMLLKTTWLPVYAYFIVVIIIVYSFWEEDSFISYLKGTSFSDVILFIGGLAGAILSGYLIKMLRDKGYKMY
ncbi:YuiB family protein [Paenibacillus psychroresistens]|uniref:YuiB family protein n=1 Tax=Paenibacillus psychroresistens TaxID=1778678 RepID=UPI001D04EDC2|nr:YuiB family protein [Paenibacillus psychroresistens]